MNHEQKSILITGCSSGIGQACAIRFAQAGWQVYATVRALDDGAALRSWSNVQVLVLDVTEPAAIELALAPLREQGVRLDVVLNNAGFGVFGPFETTSAALIERQFATNLGGVLNMTQAVLPILRQQRHGLIMNVSSVGGLSALPLFSLYHASKYAVIGFSESLQYELAKFGIRVKIIAPGFVNTDFAGRSLRTSFDHTAHPYQRAVGQMIAFFQHNPYRAAEASDAADAIYAAAIDPSEQLLYVVGEDAQQMLHQRQQMGDGPYMQQLGLLTGVTA